MSQKAGLPFMTQLRKVFIHNISIHWTHNLNVKKYRGFIEKNDELTTLRILVFDTKAEK